MDGGNRHFKWDEWLAALNQSDAHVNVGLLLQDIVTAIGRLEMAQTSGTFPALSDGRKKPSKPKKGKR